MSERLAPGSCAIPDPSEEMRFSGASGSRVLYGCSFIICIYAEVGGGGGVARGGAVGGGVQLT